MVHDEKLVGVFKNGLYSDYLSMLNMFSVLDDYTKKFTLLSLVSMHNKHEQKQIMLVQFMQVGPCSPTVQTKTCIERP